MSEQREKFPLVEHKEFNFQGVSVEGIQQLNSPFKEYVLFIPGQGLTAENGKPIIESFAQKGFSSFTMDLRGRGKSYKPDNFPKTKLEDYIKDVSQATEGLEKEIKLSKNEQILMGFSAGGLIAAQYAIENPPKGLVLVSSTLPRDLRFFAETEGVEGEKRRKKYLATLEPLIQNNLSYDKDALINFYVGRGVFPKERVEELSHLVDQESPTFVAERYNLIDINPEQIKCPILVIGIDGDKAIPAESSRQLADFLKADYVEGKGSHMIMFEEEWKNLADEIQSWIKRLK